MEECGLFLDTDNPFIGASPDRIVSCSCHGKMCVEIKCPYSISHLSPNDDNANIAFLDRKNGSLSLKKTHAYYTQCQLQLGVAKLNKCYFFVYTAHGFILNEIDFDVNFFSDISEKCCRFYRDYYLKSFYK